MLLSWIRNIFSSFFPCETYILKLALLQTGYSDNKLKRVLRLTEHKTEYPEEEKVIEEPICHAKKEPPRKFKMNWRNIRMKKHSLSTGRSTTSHAAQKRRRSTWKIPKTQLNSIPRLRLYSQRSNVQGDQFTKKITSKCSNKKERKSSLT